MTVTKENYNYVIERDNYSCRLCGSAKLLQLHHILYRSQRKDLINDINYTTDNNKKAYVLEETLVEIDIRDFREDYNYLLSRHNDKKKTKKKHWYNR